MAPTLPVTRTPLDMSLRCGAQNAHFNALLDKM